MAEPVYFAGHQRAIAGPPGTEDRIKPLPLYSGNGEHISCWKLDPVELNQVLATGELWVSVRSGDKVFPMFVSGHPLMEAFDLDTGDRAVYYSDGQHAVDDARRFAILHHGDQPYGESELRHTYHIEKVVDVLRDFGLPWQYLVAGYGHDLEEDCFLDLPMLERRKVVADRFGESIEAMIWACTGVMHIDGVKQNRAARNLQQYAKIAALPSAAPVKCGDRTANMEECVRTCAERMGRIYFGEVMDFDDKVGSYCPLVMRQRLLHAALNIASYLGLTESETLPVRARLDEITASIVDAHTQAA